MPKRETPERRLRRKIRESGRKALTAWETIVAEDLGLIPRLSEKKLIDIHHD